METPEKYTTKVVEKSKALFTYITLYCVCGHAFLWVDTHIECSNPACNLYGKKFKVPAIELEEK